MLAGGHFRRRRLRGQGFDGRLGSANRQHLRAVGRDAVVEHHQVRGNGLRFAARDRHRVELAVAQEEHRLAIRGELRRHVRPDGERGFFRTIRLHQHQAHLRQRQRQLRAVRAEGVGRAFHHRRQRVFRVLRGAVRHLHLAQRHRFQLLVFGEFRHQHQRGGAVGAERAQQTFAQRLIAGAVGIHHVRGELLLFVNGGIGDELAIFAHLRAGAGGQYFDLAFRVNAAEAGQRRRGGIGIRVQLHHQHRAVGTGHRGGADEAVLAGGGGEVAAVGAVELAGVDIETALVEQRATVRGKTRRAQVHQRAVGQIIRELFGRAIRQRHQEDIQAHLAQVFRRAHLRLHGQRGGHAVESDSHRQHVVADCRRAAQRGDARLGGHEAQRGVEEGRHRQRDGLAVLLRLDLTQRESKRLLAAGEGDDPLRRGDGGAAQLGQRARRYHAGLREDQYRRRLRHHRHGSRRAGQQATERERAPEYNHCETHAFILSSEG
ncbi:MAG: hypothetical protein BWY76_03168 [bacterium ADurb.Bin429]|nr:MAG: hypothetical protein BWY76_03168 [bacterium ADurb.Bin429]